jgi:hypothetical protein
MKYLKADIPCNYFYFVVDDSVDVANLKFDFIKNKLTDLDGNEVQKLNKVYCMGANQEEATSSIIQVETLPFPVDKTI